MTDTLKRVAALWSLSVMIVLATAMSAISQQPTDEQRNAIRSACRSDYEVNCASVPPGGAASLQCLQKNMSKLSGSCQQAVKAIEPAAAPKAETAPAPAAPAPAKAAAPAAAPKAAATTPSQKPTDAQTAAIRSACRSDYQKNCASVPPGGAPALNCLEKNKSKLSASCQQAVNAVSGGTAAPAEGSAAPAASSAAAPAPALVLRPMRPREELFVLRSACGGDVRALCGGVAPGGGRIVQCLAVRAGSLSPACKDVLSQFAAQ
ncbi:cysteine rich repeat-containing protein [Afipia sp. DC4300-2b1]|uniref:cysteine rich repeat-containing protein n=1 Tax=Afipia sp. DC4300-2b1 TaxID=2804672 RepID=UPI003CEFCCCB